MKQSGDELIEKADALLARWRTGSPAGDVALDYPVLTEVVETNESKTSPAAAAPAAQPSRNEIAAFEERLERRVIEEIKPMIADLITGALGSRLEQAAQQLAAELSAQLSREMVDLVRNTVRSSLEHEFAELLDQRPGTMNS